MKGQHMHRLVCADFPPTRTRGGILTVALLVLLLSWAIAWPQNFSPDIPGVPLHLVLQQPLPEVTVPSPCADLLPLMVQVRQDIWWQRLIGPDQQRTQAAWLASCQHDPWPQRLTALEP